MMTPGGKLIRLIDRLTRGGSFTKGEQRPGLDTERRSEKHRVVVTRSRPAWTARAANSRAAMRSPWSKCSRARRGSAKAYRTRSPSADQHLIELILGRRQLTLPAKHLAEFLNTMDDGLGVRP